MSDRFDRDASQIIDLARKSAGADADGQLLLYVSGMLRLAHMRGEHDGFQRARTEIFADLEKLTAPAPQGFASETDHGG